MFNSNVQLHVNLSAFLPSSQEFTEAQTCSPVECGSVKVSGGAAASDGLISGNSGNSFHSCRSH